MTIRAVRLASGQLDNREGIMVALDDYGYQSVLGGEHFYTLEDANSLHELLGRLLHCRSEGCVCYLAGLEEGIDNPHV